MLPKIALAAWGLIALAYAGLAAAQTPAQPATGPSPAPPQEELSDAGLLYELRCKACHEPAVPGAPGRAEMAAKPKGFLVKAMAEGVMHPLSTGLSAAEISDIADYIHSTGGR